MPEFELAQGGWVASGTFVPSVLPWMVDGGEIASGTYIFEPDL